MDSSFFAKITTPLMREYINLKEANQNDYIYNLITYGTDISSG